MASDHIKIEEIWISRDKTSSRVKEILASAEKNGIPVFFKKRLVLDHLLPGIPHQNILALTRDFFYKDLMDLVHISKGNNTLGLLVAADHITDEGNLGAIIRTCVFFGAHGLIIPRDRAARITRTVTKRSAGAYVHLPVARVVNLGRALNILNEKGYWIIGAAVEGDENVFRFDWKRDIVLVLGSEDKGLSKGIKRLCHQLVRIPSAGNMAALNVSVACGVLLSEISRQRNVE